MSPTQPPAGATDPSRTYYPALDGLRACAFLMVLFQHYVSLPWGWTGVNIFFVLSGFLITGILFDTRDDPHRVRNFYLRRTLRIFPLYYGIILLLALLYPWLHWSWSLAWIAWPLYLGNFLRFLAPGSAQKGSPLELAADARTRSPNLGGTLYFGHLWSLCVEEQFYLLWPWMVFWTRSRRLLLWICGSVVVLVPLLRMAAQHAAPVWMLKAELLYRATPFQFDALLLGAWIALLWRGPHRNRLLQIARIVAVICALVATAYLARTVHGKFELYPYPVWQFTLGLTFVNVFAASLILCCLHGAGWLQRCLSIELLRGLGRISYGAYIFHDVFHMYLVALGARLFTRHFSLRGPFTALAALVLSSLLAWLSYHFYESHFLRLKQRFSR